MKAPTGELAFAYRTIAALEVERDTLAQRRRELEQCMSEPLNKLVLERNALRAEVERLREIREIARQCAANGGCLSSADLIELRELLKK